MTERTYTADEVDAMIARAIARERDREQPAQDEPVEWLTGCPECGMDSCECGSGKFSPQAREQPAQQKPVAWMDAEGDVYRTEPDKNWCPPHYPLYAAPQPAQQPLTDEQIAEALRLHGLTLVKTATGYAVLKLGQITAHGITGEKK